jgi:hypothetical protein
MICSRRCEITQAAVVSPWRTQHNFKRRQDYGQSHHGGPGTSIAAFDGRPRHLNRS